MKSPSKPARTAKAPERRARRGRKRRPRGQSNTVPARRSKGMRELPLTMRAGVGSRCASIARD